MAGVVLYADAELNMASPVPASDLDQPSLNVRPKTHHHQVCGARCNTIVNCKEILVAACLEAAQENSFNNPHHRFTNKTLDYTFENLQGKMNLHSIHDFQSAFAYTITLLERTVTPERTARKNGDTHDFQQERKNGQER